MKRTGKKPSLITQTGMIIFFLWVPSDDELTMIKKING